MTGVIESFFGVSTFERRRRLRRLQLPVEGCPPESRRPSSSTSMRM
jgi:hypothetical protein